MRGINGKLLTLCAVATLLYSCEKEEEIFDSARVGKQTAEECDMITFEGQSGYLDQIVSEGGMHLNVAGIARDANDEPVMQNRAMIFDSEHWTGDDDDLATTDWGNVLITQQLGDEGAPNDNQWGSELRITFPERVTLKSMKVLDIDDFEDDSWAFLYIAGQDEPVKIYLEPHGDNVGFTVDLLNTANVVKLVIWFDGDGAYGSGAIDDISFCMTPQEPEMACDMITFEGQSGYLDQIVSEGGMHLNVAGIARDANDEPVMQNRAMIFDSEHWTGDDDDLATTDWGNVLITQQLGDEGAPNDNQWGSELRITFPERVTLKSMKVLDIDDFEDDSWAFLYIAGQDEPVKIYLEPHGDNVGFTVDLLNTANVVKLVIWFDGDGAYGSGAIDDISFCMTPQ